MKLVLETATGFETLLDDGGSDDRLVGVIAGDDLALHHVAGSADEARLLAIDLAARPIDELHVAIGPADADGCWLALVHRDALRAHLARFRAAGVTPAQLLPAALLLPGDGPVAAPLGDHMLLRTADLAACVEPGLLAALGGADARSLPAFHPTLAEPLPLDLLQGEFAPSLRWWTKRSFQLAAGLLLALLLLAAVAPQWIASHRVAALVGQQDRETIELAKNALGEAPDNAETAGSALFAARDAAEGRLLGPRLAYLAEAVANSPGASLETVHLQVDGGLDVEGAGSADAINRLHAFLQSGPYALEANGPRFHLGGRQPARPNADPLLSARLRFATARQDAAFLQSQPESPISAADAVAQLTASIAGSHGEAGAAGPAGPAGLLVVVPAARADVLLPLLAALEQQGARFRDARIERNPDDTLRATLELQ